MTWEVVTKFDRRACDLADRHYSRRKIGAPQFMPPGETLILYCSGAVFGWWRPHPRSGLRAMNGLDGWTCTIFRNESDCLSSDLILEAEEALKRTGRNCGPHGLLTYVYDRKIRSTNPGFCFKKAGWSLFVGLNGEVRRSADGKKTLLSKPWDAI